jgi:hypothetical protein
MASGELDWMPVGEDRPELAGLADKHGLSAIAGEYQYSDMAARATGAPCRQLDADSND